MTNQIIGLIGGRKVLPRISPSGLSMNKRTTVWRRYHQNHMPLLAFCHADRDPRPSAGWGGGQTQETYQLTSKTITFIFLFFCCACVRWGWSFFFYWNTKTGNPELLQLCHASVEKAGGGGGRDVGGKGEGGGATALTSSKCDTASDDIMNA